MGRRPPQPSVSTEIEALKHRLSSMKPRELVSSRILTLGQLHCPFHRSRFAPRPRFLLELSSFCSFSPSRKHGALCALLVNPLAISFLANMGLYTTIGRDWLSTLQTLEPPALTILDSIAASSSFARMIGSNTCTLLDREIPSLLKWIRS